MNILDYRCVLPTLLLAVACASGPPADGNGSGGSAGSGSAGSGGAGSGSAGSGAAASGGTLSSGGSTGGGGALGSGGAAPSSGGSGAVGTGGGATGGSGGGTETLSDGSPLLLSQTGLYQADMVTLAAGVRPFQPRFALWSDDAAKKRWALLPEDAQIDTTDMNYWEYPAGTRLFKEFSQSGVRVETRMLTKRVQGGWQRVAYQWREDQTEADAVPAGVQNASGTEHDIPSQEDCGTCHFRMPDKVLGFSAIQLAWDNPDPEAWTLDELALAGKLTSPPPAIQVPGDEIAQAALGYMHANCGHCHNPQSSVSTRVTLQFWLRTDTLDTVEGTPTYSSTVCQDIELAEDAVPGIPLIIDPGSPDTSAAFLRVDSRGEAYSMPPLGTELVDMTGRDAVGAWIESLDAVSCP